MPAGLPDLGQLVADEADGEDVEQALDEIEISVGVDGVDGARVQGQVDERDEELGGILVDGARMRSGSK